MGDARPARPLLVLRRVDRSNHHAVVTARQALGLQRDAPLLRPLRPQQDRLAAVAEAADRARFRLEGGAALVLHLPLHARDRYEHAPDLAGHGDAVGALAALVVGPAREVQLAPRHGALAVEVRDRRGLVPAGGAG